MSRTAVVGPSISYFKNRPMKPVIFLLIWVYNLILDKAECEEGLALLWDNQASYTKSALLTRMGEPLCLLCPD